MDQNLGEFESSTSVPDLPVISEGGGSARYMRVVVVNGEIPKRGMQAEVGTANEWLRR